MNREINMYGVVILVLILLNCTTIQIDATTKNESLDLHTIEVDNEIQHYFIYLPSANPAGAVLMLPGGNGNHYQFICSPGFVINATETMLNAPIINTARKYCLALVLAEGEEGNYYSPNNGEKKVLACLEDANSTILKLNSQKWFIFGASMGGTGALSVTVRFPKLFAGLFCGYGFTNFYSTDMKIRLNSTWPSDEVIKEACPLHHPEAFRDKAIYLTHGINDTTVPIIHSDNFSKILDLNGIQHYYYRDYYGHDPQLVLKTVDQVFDMFSYTLNGNLDQFFLDYATSLKTSSTSNATNWVSYISFSFYLSLIVMVYIIKLDKRKIFK